MGRRNIVSLVVGAAVLAALPAAAASPAATAANEDGTRLFRAGAVAEAVERFEQAIALDTGFAEARRNLAVALATRGQGELHAGRLDEAREHLERAAALAPAEAAYHLLLGVLFFRRGDLFEARLRVDRALELAPGLAEARELSGDLHYQEGWLDRARAEWETALPGAGARQPALRAKLDRLGREAGAEGGFGRDVSRHFTIQYDGPIPGEVARTALRLLESAHERLGRELGRPPQHDVPVILYSRAHFDEITRSPDWVAATYDGKIRVPVGGLRTAADAERLGPILAHELTHAFLRAGVPGRLPLWFEEGLAMHFEGATAETALRALRAAGGFTSLEAVSAALRGGPRVDAAYAAAALALAEMVRLDGLWLPRRTLELAAGGRPFDEAFRAAAGIDLAAFEQRWLRAQR